MAGPVTHIVLALKMFPLLAGFFDKTEFLVGTSFPDIRHLAHLSREETHLEPVSWEHVLHAESSFKAGMLFHNLVDHARLDYFAGNYFDENQPSRADNSLYYSLYPIAQKMVEDAFMYPLCQEWPAIIELFDKVYTQELELCHDEEIVKNWHTLLRNYFAYEPTLESTENFLKGVGNLYLMMDVETFNPYEKLQNLFANQDFYQAVYRFYDIFGVLIGLEKYEKIDSLHSRIGYPVACW
ncbi:MAG: hypothetical protein AB7R69_05505 [Candidatus Babeliales bacterium]